jgi:hypothetical protein
VPRSLVVVGPLHQSRAALCLKVAEARRMPKDTRQGELDPKNPRQRRDAVMLKEGKTHGVRQERPRIAQVRGDGSPVPNP